MEFVINVLQLCIVIFVVCCVMYVLTMLCVLGIVEVVDFDTPSVWCYVYLPACLTDFLTSC